MTAVVAWSGHVRILVDDQGKTVVYQTDGDPDEHSFDPHGFFETKAINGLLQELTGGKT